MSEFKLILYSKTRSVPKTWKTHTHWCTQRCVLCPGITMSVGQSPALYCQMQDCKGSCVTSIGTELLVQGEKINWNLQNTLTESVSAERCGGREAPGSGCWKLNEVIYSICLGKGHIPKGADKTICWAGISLTIITTNFGLKKKTTYRYLFINPYFELEQPVLSSFMEHPDVLSIPQKGKRQYRIANLLQSPQDVNHPAKNASSSELVWHLIPFLICTEPAGLTVDLFAFHLEIFRTLYCSRTSLVNIPREQRWCWFCLVSCGAMFYPGSCTPAMSLCVLHKRPQWLFIFSYYLKLPTTWSVNMHSRFNPRHDCNVRRIIR